MPKKCQDKLLLTNEAFITPRLKKPNLDSNVLKNYRPVSIYHSFRVSSCNPAKTSCANQQTGDIILSAYKTNHSTENALVRVQNNQPHAVDTDSVAILILLDLSAAFDTTYHHILLNTLQYYLGITGYALEWFRSLVLPESQSAD